MIFRYCPACGGSLVLKNIGDEGEIPFCDHCRRPWFSMSCPCVIVLTVNEKSEVALIRQGYVSATNYVCVAGYIKAGETAEHTAMREVSEEIGLAVSDVKYIRSYYFEKHDNLMLGFVCSVEKKDFKLSGEVDSAEWFSFHDALDQLREGSIARQLLLDYMREEKISKPQ